MQRLPRIVIALAALAALAGCEVRRAEAESTAAKRAAAKPPPAIQYPEGHRHSPITVEIAQRLAAIADAGPRQADHVFAKLGDSITESASFLRCFAGDDADLGDHAALYETVGYFRAGDAGGVTPFERASLAAVSGWAARGPLGGDPTPLDRELSAIAPRYAVVMFGSNDAGYRSADQFGSDLWTIVDTLIARGVVPVLSTIPPIDNDAAADARVPTFNRVIRALAQGRQIPLVDFHRELEPLADHGLFRDGLHPSTSPLGACVLTAQGLQSGYNIRNLLTLEALDRARHAVAGDAAPDREAPVRRGHGTHADPFVAALPFVDLGDTRDGDTGLEGYACAADHPEGGRERVYRLELAERTTIAATVVDRGDTDVDVHLLDGELRAESCVARGHQDASATVGPGTVYVVVDSFVDDAGTAHEGEYLLVIESHPPAQDQPVSSPAAP